MINHGQVGVDRNSSQRKINARNIVSFEKRMRSFRCLRGKLTLANSAAVGLPVRLLDTLWLTFACLIVSGYFLNSILLFPIHDWNHNYSTTFKTVMPACLFVDDLTTCQYICVSNVNYLILFQMPGLP